MTEAEWNSCTDPAAMVEVLRTGERVSNRQLQLFSSACRLRIPAAAAIRWEHLSRGGHPPNVASSRAAVPGERKEFVRARLDAETAVAIITCETNRRARKQAVMALERAAQCELLRDIFGNPFRTPPVLPASCLTPAVVTLAQDIYDRRAFESTRELADALEAAGCRDAELLAHLRSPGPHVRGCFAVDLVLGKD
jgi:hypothetical protein